MSIKVESHWPLVVVPPSKEDGLQRKSTIHFALQSPQQAIHRVNTPAGLDSGPSWRKGTFIDIYV